MSGAVFPSLGILPVPDLAVVLEQAGGLTVGVKESHFWRISKPLMW